MTSQQPRLLSCNFTVKHAREGEQNRQTCVLTGSDVGEHDVGAFLALDRGAAHVQGDRERAAIA